MNSYIVTGVILVYNDIIIITLCVFAVYGVYAVIREIAMLFLKKRGLVLAIKMDSDMRKDERADAVALAENCIYKHSFLNRTPIIICDKAVDDYKKYGYKIYVRYTEEK